MKKIIIATLTYGLLVSGVHAQTIETLVNNLFNSGQLISLTGLIEGFAYLGAIALGIKGALKLNEWNESKGRQVKMTTGLIYILCAGLLLGLPTLISVGSSTLLGTEAKKEFNSSSGQYGGQY